MQRTRIWGRQGFGLAHLLAAVLFCFLIVPPNFAQAELPRRSLELELEEVPGSTGYELRVEKILADKSKKPPVYFKLKSVKWAATLLPGKYSLEFRSFDGRHVPGPWSAPQEFAVKLPPPELTEPVSHGRVVSDDDKTEKVTFSWKAVEEAEKYKLKIMKTDGTVIQESFETDTSAKVKLPVAVEYMWTVTAYMAGDLEGETTVVPSHFELVGGPLDKPKIFPIDDINTNQFEWGAARYANKYDLTLEAQQKDETWKVIETKTAAGEKRVLKDPLPTGRYRVKILALGDLRQSSEAAKAEFKTLYINTRSPAAIEQVKSEGSYETKSTVFGLASYFVTFVNYNGSNSDSQSYNSTFTGVGGTGRLGLGTWFKEDNKIGLMTTADLSGFTINGQTFTYYSQTLQGVYRERLGVLGQLRINFGAEYRDLPVTLATNPALGSASPTFQSNLTTAGPLLGVTLAHGFNHKIGMQLNLQIMDSAFGLQTPNGQSNVPVFSYQAGLLGSMNLGPHLVGFVGYTYRDEKGTYAVTPTSSAVGVNSSEVTGHYLNLLMEYGF